MISRLTNVPALSILLLTSLLCITLLTGCPAAQQPTIPAQEEEGGQAQQAPPTPDNGLDRPIQPPDIETTTTTSDPGGNVPTEPGEGGDGENGGDQDTGGTVVLSNLAPSNGLTARAGPDDVVNLSFNLASGVASIAGADLLLARDDDGDGEPDGEPVLEQPFAISAGTNTVPFHTQVTNAAHLNLLTNEFGQFVIGVRATTVAGAVRTEYASGTVTIDDLPPVVTWMGAGSDPNSLDLKDYLVSRETVWYTQLTISDNSPHTVQIVLDQDLNPDNGWDFELVPTQGFAAGTATHTFFKWLKTALQRKYYYYVVVSDGVVPPESSFYAPGAVAGNYAIVQISDRFIGEFDLNDLPDSGQGAILQGFNFNDLAGSSMTGVPDLDGDGFDELVIVSRFGKPHLATTDGVGWGEAYLVLGQGPRLNGTLRVNAVGEIDPNKVSIDGLVFTGIRCPTTTSWTEGISDVTFVPDMDGDGLPDLVFSFPRVESISLANPEWAWQSDDMGAYAMWMGALEYDPLDDVVDTIDIPDPNNPGQFLVQRSDYEVDVGGQTWLKNRTQFTRGGIVIVSSATTMFKSRTQLNSKYNRIIDLHETGQVFNSMSREDDFSPLIEETTAPLALETFCDDTLTEYEQITVYWDIIQSSVGPIGFDNWLTNRDFQDPLNPPIANMWSTGLSLGTIGAEYLAPNSDPCDESHCVVFNQWLPYTPCNPVNTGTGSMYFHPLDSPATDAGHYIHTGFCGAKNDPEVSPWGTNVGARVLGQRVNSRFGTAVSADGTWLYMSSPHRSAQWDDVPDLGAEEERELSGVVYQFRTYSPSYVGGPTSSQLWIEPGNRTILDPNNPDLDPDDPNDTGDPNNYIEVQAAWPYPDIHRPRHEDYPMPAPHTYIIEDRGSHRGRDLFWYDELLRLGQEVPEEEDDFEVDVRSIDYPQALGLPAETCAVDRIVPANATVQGGVRPMAPCETGGVWPSGGVGSSNWYITRTPQIVGPHPGAQISFVRAVGDVDDDGVEDFAVGSEHVTSDILSGTGTEVGAIFIVYGRPTGLEGDYLLEELAYDIGDLNRLAGVVLKGTSANEKLARVFDGAGDFNGMGADDVVIGNEVGSGGRGEAIVLLGSATLLSPGGGWTVDEAVTSGDAVRFVGEEVGDLAGANVAGAGDLDADGIGDILIAAPGAERDVGGNAKGAVYLIYGSDELFEGGETISLSEIGTVNLPGVKFIGRNYGDALGGGVLTYGDGMAGNPNRDVFLNPNNTPIDVYSDGVVSIGDLNHDGKADIAISAMLADPLSRRDAGEVYIIYGR